MAAAFKCTECTYVTPRVSNLNRHKNKHTKTPKKKEKTVEEVRFECNQCKNAMKTKGSLKTHEKKQHRYSCLNCVDKFLIENDLHKHQNIMHGPGTHPQVEQEKNVAAEKEAQCRFGDPITVDLEEEGKYTLEICNEIDCGLRYAEKKLKKKMKKELIQQESESIIHTSRKCPKCDSVFINKTSQKCHMKQKHGVKPMNQCWLCLKAHGKKDDLKSHINKKHNDFQCPFCTVKITEEWQHDEIKQHFERHQSFEWRKNLMEESNKPSFHDLCPFKGCKEIKDVF